MQGWTEWAAGRGQTTLPDRGANADVSAGRIVIGVLARRRVDHDGALAVVRRVDRHWNSAECGLAGFRCSIDRWFRLRRCGLLGGRCESGRPIAARRGTLRGG